MIAFVEGKLVAKEPRCLVSLGGIALELNVPSRDLDSLAADGTKVGFHTYLYVREDRLALYGFLDRRDRELFTKLIEVSGVGPKIALGLLSHQRAGRIAAAIQSGDTGFLCSLPGLGRRTAERLVTELKDKLEAPVVGEQADERERIREEVIRALTSLGMSRSAAEEAVAQVKMEQLDPPTVEEVVKEALKSAGQP